MAGSVDPEPLAVALHHAFECMELEVPLRDRRLAPHLSDGVALRDVVVTERGMSAAGWVWMVDSQRCTPMLLWASRLGGVVEVELRFGIEGMLLDPDELDWMWRRGHLPGPDADWLLRFQDRIEP